MINRRVREANVTARATCHTFRATRITNFLENGGMFEEAAEIAAHESTRTTGLYDRRKDKMTLEAIELICFWLA
jgi:integrase